MRFPLAEQLRLLDLQAVDLELTRVRHRLRLAPAGATLRALLDQQDQLRRTIVTTRTDHEDLQRAINRCEQDLQRVRARQERDRALADQGASGKLQRELDHELASLARRLSALEDEELQLLERQDELAGQLAALQQRDAELGAQVAAERTAASAADQADHGREAELGAGRAALVQEISPDLVRRYEQIRAGTPIAAARLADEQCGGCRLQLPPADVDRLLALPADEVATCEECGCILVRA